jgi:hypothetical protein
VAPAPYATLITPQDVGGGGVKSIAIIQYDQLQSWGNSLKRRRSCSFKDRLPTCGTGAIHPLEGLAVLAATSLSTVFAFAMLILNLAALPYVNNDSKP